MRPQGQGHPEGHAARPHRGLNHLAPDFFLSNLQRARIANEAKRVSEASISLRAKHPFLWHGRLQGKGQWSRQVFPIEIVLPPEYPVKPPLVRFLQQPVPPHPNVSPQGFVCLNHLLSAWTPINNLVSVWDELGWLLENPNYKSGFVPPGYVEGHHAPQFVRRIEQRVQPNVALESVLDRLRRENRRRYDL